MAENNKHANRFSRRTLLKSVAGTSALAFTSTPGRATSNRHATRQDVSQPPPKGDPLSSEEIRLLALMFNDTPYTGGQDTPNHVWKWVTDDSFIFFHFDQADVTEATALDYFGLGVKGTFCAETQPDADQGAFPHFHNRRASNWDLGHGGQPGDEGYWLLHVATREFDAPWGHITPGVDYTFHPTPPSECGESPKPTFSPAGADQLSQAELVALSLLFEDNMFKGGQDTPHHVWKWVNENVFIFLQFDQADILEATALDYIGIGVRGQFCEEQQPHPDFTHFHKWTSPQWDLAHGGEAGDYGYWLLHVAVREFETPWGQVVPGVDRNFHPTPPPTCTSNQ